MITPEVNKHAINNIYWLKVKVHDKHMANTNNNAWSVYNIRRTSRGVETV